MFEISSFPFVFLTHTNWSQLVRSLAELDLGLKGDLQMSERMEVLQLALAEDRVCTLIPPSRLCILECIIGGPSPERFVPFCV